MVGPPYQVVRRLFLTAEDYWPFLVARYNNINLIKEDVDRFCDLVYVWCREVIEPDKVEQFEAELLTPIPGQNLEVSDATAEVEGDAFMEMMGMMGGGG